MKSLLSCLRSFLLNSGDASEVPGWTLDKALVLIRGMQADCMANGYYIALAGGVLNKGFSTDDLDLVAFPRTLKSDATDLFGPLCRAEIYCTGFSMEDCYFHMVCRHYERSGQILKVEIAIPTESVPSIRVDPSMLVYH